MKKILLLLLVVGFSALSSLNAHDVKRFTRNSGTPMVGGQIGKTIIFAYSKNKFAKNTSVKDIKQYFNILACSVPMVRRYVRRGIKILYIYPSDDLKVMTVVSITKCK